MFSSFSQKLGQSMLHFCNSYFIKINEMKWHGFSPGFFYGGDFVQEVELIGRILFSFMLCCHSRQCCGPCLEDQTLKLNNVTQSLCQWSSLLTPDLCIFLYNKSVAHQQGLKLFVWVAYCDSFYRFPFPVKRFIYLKSLHHTCLIQIIIMKSAGLNHALQSAFP